MQTRPPECAAVVHVCRARRTQRKTPARVGEGLILYGPNGQLERQVIELV
jgi:hypothetical protein